ncbi:uncharacterized protein G2W53_009771 [Senna tora]|uniref:Uncharacterized protein n=1 Tax=Senna tora TaxID=362788 RepID=A0A834WZG4_9FABA|nr:uncharacterized protein G2W53_009771 [Senna tora]
MAWEERGSYLNMFRTRNRGRISETFMNYEATDLLRNRHGIGGAWIISSHVSDEKPRSDLRNLHELRGKRLVAQVSETRRFALYLQTGVDLMLQLESSSHGRSMGPVFTNFGRQIAVGSQKPSRITRQKTCCAIVKAWEERGSCLNIFQTRNRGRISETFTNYEAKDLMRNGFDDPIGVVMAWEERGSCLNIFRMTNHGRISETFTNYEAKDLLRNGFDAPIGVVMAWEERGSCLNIFRMKNHCRISETFTNYEAKDLLRKSVDHVLPYSARKIVVGSQKPSRIKRQKTCCESELNTTVRVVFANRSGFDAPIGVVMAWEERGSYLNMFRTRNRVPNRSGFDAPIGVVMAWEERGSCLNIFQMRNHGRISETITNYEAKELLRENLHELRGKRLVAQVSETRRFALYLRPRVDLMLQMELSWHGRSVDHVLTYSERQIAVGSQKSSRITRQRTCSASERNTSVRVVFANQSGFDAPIGVYLAREERGSSLNIFRTRNCFRNSETFLNYEAKDLLRK